MERTRNIIHRTLCMDLSKESAKALFLRATH